MGPASAMAIDCSEPIAAPGARVVVGPLLRLELDSNKGDGGKGDAMARRQQQKPRARGALERAYWDWRLRSDLLQIDAAFLAFTATQALLMGSTLSSGDASAAGSGAPALLLAACLLQGGAMLAAPSVYASARVPLLCAVRALHVAAGCLSQLALESRLAAAGTTGAAFAPAAGAAGASQPHPASSALQAALACTGIGRLVLQPLGLQLPLRVALPLQVLDFAAARAAGAGAAWRVARQIEAGGSRLGTALHFVHDALDALFHVSTALLFPGAYDLTLSCSAAAVELLLSFLQLLIGCLLPLYAAYCGELSGKLAFVAQWAAARGLSARTESARARRRQAEASQAGGGTAEGEGAADGASTDSSRGSSGSGSGDGGGGGRGRVYVSLRGPLTLVEVKSVGGGRIIAPHAHAAWLLLLTVVAWGLISQMPLLAARRGAT